MSVIENLISKEGGINVECFTEFSVDIGNYNVTILKHYSLHYDDYDFWPERCKTAPRHPKYYGCEIWREEEGRKATHYFVPVKCEGSDVYIGWTPISNPRYIFDYDSVSLEYDRAPVEPNLIVDEFSLIKPYKSSLKDTDFTDTAPSDAIITELQKEDKMSSLLSKNYEPNMYPNKGKRWTETDEKNLMCWYSEGLDVNDISKELGRTPLAIACRLVSKNIISTMTDAKGFSGEIPERLAKIGVVGNLHM